MMIRMIDNVFVLLLAKLAKIIFLFGGLLFAKSLLANEVVVAIPEPEAPYYDRSNDQGAEMDVIRLAFKQAGYEFLPYYLGYYDIPDALDNGDIDCATSLTPFKGLKSFYSDPLVPHPVVAISLKKNRITINSVTDLQTIDFVPFLGATEELGEAYKKMLNKHKNRPEQTTATRMVNLLFRDKVPVIIMDKHIFEHNRDRFGHREERMQKVDYHMIFKPLSYPLTCKSETISKKFTQSLRLLRKNGQYQAIIKRYFDGKQNHIKKTNETTPSKPNNL